MLFNKKKIDLIISNESSNHKNNYFDESFFMYLENNDLCKRLIEKGESIFIAPKAKINHLGAKQLIKNIIKKLNYQETGIGYGLNFILKKNILDF